MQIHKIIHKIIRLKKPLTLKVVKCFDLAPTGKQGRCHMSLKGTGIQKERCLLWKSFSFCLSRNWAKQDKAHMETVWLRAITLERFYTTLARSKLTVIWPTSLSLKVLQETSRQASTYQNLFYCNVLFTPDVTCDIYNSHLAWLDCVPKCQSALN